MIVGWISVLVQCSSKISLEGVLSSSTFFPLYWVSVQDVTVVVSVFPHFNGISSTFVHVHRTTANLRPRNR